MLNIQSHISNEVLPFFPGDKVEKALAVFSESNATHIPVVEDNFLLGNLSSEDVLVFEKEKSIADYAYALDAFFVRADTNWLDVLEAFAQNNANVMPVLDEQSAYLGYYDLIDVVSLFKETPFLNEPGSILIVEKGSSDYSFSEASQIVESNDGKILGMFISEVRDDMVQLTLKVGNVGLNNIIQTFRRYSYRVVSGNEDDIYLEELKERSEYLKKFLNI